MKSEDKLVIKSGFKWIGISALYLILALADGLLTYINTPDLSREGNPLVKYWGMGWLGLFLVNAALFAFFVLAAWYTYSRYKTQASSATKLREYFSYLLFGRTDKFIWTLYRIPKKWAPIFAGCGYAACWAWVAARAITVFEWLMVTLDIRWGAYYRLKALLPLRRVDMWAAVVIGLFLMFMWVRRQFILSGSIKGKQEVSESASLQ